MPNTIACDLDGVLANIAPEINRRCSEHFNIPIDQCKPDKFFMSDRFGVPFQEMEDFLQKECFADPEFWLAAKPFQQNIDALNDHYEDGNGIVIITGRHAHARKYTMKWLLDNDVLFDSLLMETLNKKHQAMLFSGAEIMIEDRWLEAKFIAEQTKYKSLLIRREYNIKYESESVPNLHWIDSLEQLHEHL